MEYMNHISEQNPDWVKHEIDYWKQQLQKKPKDKQVRREYSSLMNIAKHMGLKVENATEEGNGGRGVEDLIDQIINIANDNKEDLKRAGIIVNEGTNPTKDDYNKLATRVSVFSDKVENANKSLLAEINDGKAYEGKIEDYKTGIAELVSRLRSYTARMIVEAIRLGKSVNN